MKADLNKPRIIEGGLAIDDRGQLSFVNDFNFSGVKRFYVVENFSADTIRAWHGHMKEAKYVYVVSGSAIMAAVKIDNTKNPSKKTKPDRFILSARKPSILYIPKGYANGLKMLEADTKIIFFSTITIDEAKKDNYRYPHNYWGKRIWEVESR